MEDESVFDITDGYIMRRNTVFPFFFIVILTMIVCVSGKSLLDSWVLFVFYVIGLCLILKEIRKMKSAICVNSKGIMFPDRSFARWSDMENAIESYSEGRVVLRRAIRYV